MTLATADTPASEPTTARERAVDAVRQAAHVAHEARLLKTLASDAVEDGMYAAKRALTHGIRDFEELRDSAAHRIKRAPLKTVGLVFGAGILLGVALGRIRRRAAAQNQ